MSFGARSDRHEVMSFVARSDRHEVIRSAQNEKVSE